MQNGGGPNGLGPHPAPRPPSNPRVPPRRSSSLSRQKSLTDFSDAGETAVEFLSEKLSNALSLFTSTPTNLPNAAAAFSPEGAEVPVDCSGRLSNLSRSREDILGSDQAPPRSVPGHQRTISTPVTKSASVDASREAASPSSAIASTPVTYNQETIAALTSELEKKDMVTSELSRENALLKEHVHLQNEKILQLEDCITDLKSRLERNEARTEEMVRAQRAHNGTGGLAFSNTPPPRHLAASDNIGLEDGSEKSLTLSSTPSGDAEETSSAEARMRNMEFNHYRSASHAGTTAAVSPVNMLGGGDLSNLSTPDQMPVSVYRKARTPDPSRKMNNANGGPPPMNRAGSYSDKRHFMIGACGQTCGSPAGKFGAEEKCSSVPDLLEDHLTGSLMSGTGVASGGGASTPPLNRKHKSGRGLNAGGLVSKIVSQLKPTTKQPPSGSPESSPFTRGSAARSTAGARLNNTIPSDLPFDRWDTERLCFWLASLGLERYVPSVQSHALSGASLAQLTPPELEKYVGLKNSLHRKKLLLTIRAHLTGNAGHLADMDVGWVARWLDDIGLPQYKEAFVEARVDGRVLHYLTFDDLTTLKVYSALHQISIGRAVQCLRIQAWKSGCFIRRPSNQSDSPAAAGDDARLLLLWTNHRVMEWLRSIDLSEYAPNLRGSGVHGALMALEPRFNADTLGDLLLIPSSKTLLRRHLIQQFNSLVSPGCAEHKRAVEAAPTFQPLSASFKIKPVKKRSGGGGGISTPLKSKRGDSVGQMEDLVCPLEFEVPGHVPACVLPMGYHIISDDFSRTQPRMLLNTPPVPVHSSPHIGGGGRSPAPPGGPPRIADPSPLS